MRIRGASSRIMEINSGNSNGGGGGGGPAPFLLKTYEMVDDTSTDEIVSWSSANNSFVVWNPPEFSRLLLPTYFKHNNFSSFIRQLNTYGFRKIDPERWEFANEEFIKDQKHLLRNIHRRKPIHSHTHPHGSEDSERAALDEEIEKLNREKNSIKNNLYRITQQKSRTKLQLEELEHKVQEMEQRQLNMMTYLARAVNNPCFVEHLVSMGSSSMNFSAINKKRRVPKTDYGHCVDDFSNKLRLELSPGVSDTNFVSQGSNEEGMSPETRTTGESQNDVDRRTEALMLEPETLELSDTGTSFCLRKNSNSVSSNEDDDARVTCHLSLGLACSSAEVPKSDHESVTDAGKEGKATKSNTGSDGGAPARVNDVFWERFLTE